MTSLEGGQKAEGAVGCDLLPERDHDRQFDLSISMLTYMHLPVSIDTRYLMIS